MPKAKWKNFTDDELKQIVAESTSFVEAQKKLGYSGRGGSTTETLRKVFEQKNIDYSHFKGHAWNKEMSKYENALTDFGTHNWQTIKEKLFQEREYRCECCGITEWNGKEIKLQVHHIDGNHNNNTRKNLQILCPNCHSQTDNWTYKKNKNGITDEQFLEVLKNTDNICQACRILGITPNQNNYKRAHKLIENSKL
jgi:hypothetical protein